ncbi:MAG: hypothetical protein NTX21_10895 [Alphaproteobacteria bacterium]|nr:hypothetical protein [Alphaproteobacteria bacterium]
MASKAATRITLSTMLLGSSAISAHAGCFNSASSTNLETSIQQALALRLSGNYAEAVKYLSQLMMVASDDPGVVSEYGKTLAAMGRAQDAVNFLTRAVQLQPTDWTVFSTLGVAYDQIGSQKDAQGAYEHAPSLKPSEARVLSNYALSRMLANDPVMARNLADRARSARCILCGQHDRADAQHSAAPGSAAHAGGVQFHGRAAPAAGSEQRHDRCRAADGPAHGTEWRRGDAARARRSAGRPRIRPSDQRRQGAPPAGASENRRQSRTEERRCSGHEHRPFGKPKSRRDARQLDLAGREERYHAS